MINLEVQLQYPERAKGEQGKVDDAASRDLESCEVGITDFGADRPSSRLDIRGST